MKDVLSFAHHEPCHRFVPAVRLVRRPNSTGSSDRPLQASGAKTSRLPLRLVISGGSGHLRPTSVLYCSSRIVAQTDGEVTGTCLSLVSTFHPIPAQTERTNPAPKQCVLVFQVPSMGFCCKPVQGSRILVWVCVCVCVCVYIYIHICMHTHTHSLLILNYL